MKIITAKYILTFDNSNPVILDGAVAFDKKIVKVGKKDEILKKYPDAKVKDFKGESCLLPGLINTHIHLEYLANKTTLEYGEFIRWLKSVIKYQQKLMSECDDKSLKKTLDMLLKTGTTTIGEISSFGLDIDTLKKSKINVILFNEVLGSSPEGVDMMYQNFLQRYNTTKSLADERFIPAISVHSPYSTHPILAKKALETAKYDDCPVATHFMESKAEREWLDKGEGGFKEFLQKFNSYAKPLVSPKEYIKLFDGVKTLFVHACYATDEELRLIEKNGHSIVTCPVSNRLLENTKLDISKVKKYSLATDGLTSNISLNLWDELRNALFVHESLEIDDLSQKLLESVTKNAAEALNLKKGVLKEGYDSDMIVVKLPESFEETKSIYKWLILHTKEVKKAYIQGEKI